MTIAAALPLALCAERASVHHERTNRSNEVGEEAAAGGRLLLADEIRRLPADRQLLFLAGREPLATARVDYRAIDALSRRADANLMYRDV